MLYKLNRNGRPTQYYWKPQGGALWQLGTYGETAEMAAVILDHFLGKRTDPIPDLPELPAEEPCYTVPEAVASALAAGLDTSRRRLGVTIRSAAQRGSIAGAYKTPEGYWRLPVAAYNAWLAEHAEQKRGRPRKEAAEYA